MLPFAFPSRPNMRRAAPADQAQNEAATANAWGLDLEPAKERVEQPQPIIMDGSHPAAVGTNPAGFGNFLDLVAQDRILQLPQNVLRNIKQQPETLRLREPKRTRRCLFVVPFSKVVSTIIRTSMVVPLSMNH